MFLFLLNALGLCTNGASPTSKPVNEHTLWIAVGITLLVVLLIIVLIVIYYCYCRKTNDTEEKNVNSSPLLESEELQSNVTAREVFIDVTAPPLSPDPAPIPIQPVVLEQKPAPAPQNVPASEEPKKKKKKRKEKKLPPPPSPDPSLQNEDDQKFDSGDGVDVYSSDVVYSYYSDEA